MNELALFAGAGGGILGGQLLGWRTLCAVEVNPYAASVLLARQNDGLLPPFPVWDDVCTFDGRPWRGRIDVVSGGFPCQDISAAGKGEGIDGERSGLWSEMARIICEVRPRFVFVENSPVLTSRGLHRVLGDFTEFSGTSPSSRGLHRVLGDLAEMGFHAPWGVLGAADVGANHQRDRCWILAYAESIPGGAGSCEAGQIGNGSQPCRGGGGVPDPSRQRLPQPEQETIFRAGRWQEGRAVTECGGWATEPNVGRVAHGVAARVDRLKAIGNGQVPQCAAEAWRLLMNQIQHEESIRAN